MQAHTVETRSQKVEPDKPQKKLPVPKPLPEIDRGKIKLGQETDPSLKNLREFATAGLEKRTRHGSCSKFVLRNGLLFRDFQEKNDSDQPISQLVVPTEYRSHVLKVAHETLLGGHQGVRKTLSRIQNNFFWPELNADVTRYC